MTEEDVLDFLGKNNISLSELTTIETRYFYEESWTVEVVSLTGIAKVIEAAQSQKHGDKNDST
jgi:hypothetical protein